MATIGLALQILSAAGLLFGVVFGIIELSAFNTRASGLPVIVASIIGGLLGYVLGAALVALADISRNTRDMANAAERSAEALEYLAKRQKQSAPRTSRIVPAEIEQP